MRGKIKLLIAIVFCAYTYAGAVSLDSLIGGIEKKLELKVVLDTGFKGTWDITYRSFADTNELKDYLATVDYEYSKYPQGYFRATGINYLVIAKDLKVMGQKRAAVPDPYVHTLFLEKDSAYPGEYQVYVMHHELNHCAEFAAWGDMYYRWRKWERKNPCRFKYGDGGNSAYKPENRGINWRAYTHPRKGFVNLYSTTGEEEDRSEIVSLIMTDSGRHNLLEFCKKDKKLRKKVRLAMKFLDRVSGTKDNYWRREMEI